AHDVRTIALTANLLQHGDLLLPGNVGLEDDDHNRFRSLPKVSTKKPQVAACGRRICSGLTQPQTPLDRPGKTQPHVDYTVDLQPKVFHGAKANKKPNAVKHRAAAGFPRRNPGGNPDNEIDSPTRSSTSRWKRVCLSLLV